MHFKPDELNVLLRSIPAKPVTRRLFFAMVVACRRRLRKNWEATPLAKLFTLEDEWSMLKLRAQVARTREAIRKRGLLLHDAFLKFDYSRTGMLTLAEVYGAFEWLRIPVEPAEVLFFVRSVSREDHVTYNNFMELLCPPDEEAASFALLEGAAAEADGELPSTALPVDPTTPALVRQLSRVAPKGSAVLSDLSLQMDLEEAEVEKEFKRQLKLIEIEREARQREQAVMADFHWLRSTRKPGKPPYLVTRHSCYYDCARGKEGHADGLPIGLEGRGKVRYVRQGEARVPCLRLPHQSFLVARVPFSKNGGGDHLNQFTVTMQVKFTVELPKHLTSTAGFDTWSKLQEGDLPSQLRITSHHGGSGRLGAHDCYGDASSPQIRLDEWFTISASVDTAAGVMLTYVDGRLASTVKGIPELCKDGQHAIKRRLALFWTKEADQYSDAFVYVRSVAVHALVLDSEQVRKGALARLVIASLTMIASLLRCARNMRCSTAS
jgi:hypothetical protein